MVAADGKLIILDEDGNLALATQTSEALTVHSKVQMLKKPAGTALTIVGIPPGQGVHHGARPGSGIESELSVTLRIRQIVQLLMHAAWTRFLRPVITG